MSNETLMLAAEIKIVDFLHEAAYVETIYDRDITVQPYRVCTLCKSRWNFVKEGESATGKWEAVKHEPWCLYERARVRLAELPARQARRYMPRERIPDY